MVTSISTTDLIGHLDNKLIYLPHVIAWFSSSFSKEGHSNRVMLNHSYLNRNSYVRDKVYTRRSL